MLEGSTLPVSVALTTVCGFHGAGVCGTAGRPRTRCGCLGSLSRIPATRTTRTTRTATMVLMVAAAAAVAMTMAATMMAGPPTLWPTRAAATAVAAAPLSAAARRWWRRWRPLGRPRRPSAVLSAGARLRGFRPSRARRPSGRRRTWRERRATSGRRLRAHTGLPGGLTHVPPLGQSPAERRRGAGRVWRPCRRRLAMTGL
mmetsp:Transcript_18217/g.68917  ORF Transcript_18217/g.68917 Transcript_18217/m.68917 type:complete len:201 (+) Transcript_18217:1058-1660(+)